MHGNDFRDATEDEDVFTERSQELVKTLREEK